MQKTLFSLQNTLFPPLEVSRELKYVSCFLSVFYLLSAPMQQTKPWSHLCQNHPGNRATHKWRMVWRLVQGFNLLGHIYLDANRGDRIETFNLQVYKSIAFHFYLLSVVSIRVASDLINLIVCNVWSAYLILSVLPFNISWQLCILHITRIIWSNYSSSHLLPIAFSHLWIR